MKFLFSLLIIVTLTESCSTAKNTMENKIEDTTKQSNISGTYTVENAVATTKALTLTFDENSTKVSGFSGCNRFFGTYIVFVYPVANRATNSLDIIFGCFF